MLAGTQSTTTGLTLEPLGQDFQIWWWHHVLGRKRDHWPSKDSLEFLVVFDIPVHVFAVRVMHFVCLFVCRRNIKRNTLKKLMEWDEEKEIEDLKLDLPGREALGSLMVIVVHYIALLVTLTAHHNYW